MREHIIFDLDGCLSDDKHRLHLIENEAGDKLNDNPDWDKYFAMCYKDNPIWHMIGMTKALRMAYPDRIIWILTGRCETVKHETEMWLKYYDVPYDNLVMRPKNCSIRTVDWKEQVYKTEILRGDGSADMVLFAFDDNRRIIDMWRKHGITSFHMTDRYY